MSNNIYDILKTMRGLSSPKTALTEGKKAKPDFLDLNKNDNRTEPMKKAAKEKSKGAIAEAVARVEQQLAEKYMGFKKRLGEESDMKKTVIPVGVIDGPGGYEEAQKRIKDYEAGKINKDGKQLPPIEDRSKPADKPKTKAVDESGLQAYLGKKKYGEQGMKALQQAGRDGASKEKMALLRARHDKMDEDAYNEDMLSPKQQKIASMAGDPKKIDANDLKALRAGKNKKAEGNAFSGALDAARNAGKSEFEVDGKSYKVQEGSPKKKTQSPDEQHKVVAGVRDAMRKGYDNVQKGRDERAAARFVAKLKYGINDSEKTNEGWDEMLKAQKERSGPQPSGGSGIKQGTRYGGGRQTDDPETDNETGEVAKKGRGRPKKDKFAK